MQYYAKERVILSGTLFRYWPAGVVAVYHYTHKKFTVIPQVLPNTESNKKCNQHTVHLFCFLIMGNAIQRFKILYKT